MGAGMGRVLAALLAATAWGCTGQVAAPPGGPTADGGAPVDADPAAPDAPLAACQPPRQPAGAWHLARVAAPNAITAVWGGPALLVLDGAGPLARLLRSADDGRTWCQLLTPQPPRQIFRGQDPAHLLMTSLDEAAGGVRLHRSLDRGETWQRLEVVLPREPTGVFAIGPTPVLVVTFPSTDSPADDVLLSVDDGATFQARTVTVSGASGADEAPLSWWSVRRDPWAPATLLAVVTFQRPDPRAEPGTTTVEIPALIASLDFGQSWQLVEVPNAERLADLIISDSGALIAVTFENEVWMRDPQSPDWRKTGALPDLRARRLWAGFAGAGAIYLTGISPGLPASRRLLTSQDGGATWSTLVEAPFDEVMVPVEPGHFLGLSSSGLRVSRDDARSWSQALLQTGDQKVVATGSAAAPRIYSISHQSLLRSDDAGQTWTGGLLEGQRLLDIAPDPGNRDGLFGILTAPGAAGQDWGLYRSQDGGASWTAIDLGASLAAEESVREVLPLATTPPSLLVSTDAGILRSEDGGATWALVLAGRPGFLRAAPSAPGTVVAMGNAFVQSQDGGKTWTALAFINLPIDAEFHPTNADLVYLAGPSGFRAMSLSEPGRQLGTNPAIAFDGLTVFPPPRIVAATPSGGVYLVDRFNRLWHSHDQGVTWESPAPSTTGIAFEALAIDPTRPEAIFVSTDSGLMRSRFE
jgi:photosystem II stability/assembly factor-like uncharacterized protein